MDLGRLQFERKIADLERSVARLSEAVQESSKLLAKSRPPRPPIPHERRLMIAADQKWKCADPFGECILYTVGDGTFTTNIGLFEVDHMEPWCESHRTVDNVCALCPLCHNLKSRKERLRWLEDE